MTGTGVYAAIAATMADLAKLGIGKAQRNEDDGYSFRGIDDIYNALSPLLSKHRLCVMPRMLERHAAERRGPHADTVFCVTVRAAFDFVSAVDGSCHTVEMYGEAIDASDKATNKAMSAAYKYAALQTFCIPTHGDNDADRQSPRTRHDPIDPTPVQGWTQWALDIGDVVAGCETDEALTRLQNTHRETLRALAGAEPKLYESLGARIQERRRLLGPVKSDAHPKSAQNAQGTHSAPAPARKPRVRKAEDATGPAA